MKQTKYIIILFILLCGCSIRNNDQLYNLACDYEENGEYKKAIEILTEALKIVPNDIECYNNRGWDYFDIGDFQNAYRDFYKILEIEENNPAALYGIGFLYYEEQQYEKAIKLFDQVIKKIAPNGFQLKMYDNPSIDYRAPLTIDLEKVEHFKKLAKIELKNKP